MIKSGIYYIQNLTNGKLYIGSAVNIANRWACHKYRLGLGNHTSIHLQRAWDKEGESSFFFGLIEGVENLKLLLSREQYWLDWYRSYDPNIGYNICKIAGSNLGWVASEETRKKQSKVHKGKPFTEEHKAKIAKALMGKRKSEEHVQNMSKAMKGKWVGEDNPFYGKTHTEETKKIITQKFKEWLKSKDGVSFLNRSRERMHKHNPARRDL